MKVSEDTSFQIRVGGDTAMDGFSPALAFLQALKNVTIEITYDSVDVEGHYEIAVGEYRGLSYFPVREYSLKGKDAAFIGVSEFSANVEGEGGRPFTITYVPVSSITDFYIV